MRERLARGLKLAAAAPATAEQLAKINDLPGVLTTLTAADVNVLAVDLCNDQPFKDGRRCFTKASLAQMVSLMSNVKVLLAHPTWEAGEDAMPIGNTFDAMITLDLNGVTWLRVLFYTLVADDDASMLMTRVKGGVISEASVGVLFKQYTCSICGEEIGDCEHMPGMLYPPTGTCYAQIDGVDEVDEWSFVYAGMVDGTRFRLAASRAVGESGAGVDELDRVLRARYRPGPIEQYLKNDRWAFLGALSSK